GPRLLRLLPCERDLRSFRRSLRGSFRFRSFVPEEGATTRAAWGPRRPGGPHGSREGSVCASDGAEESWCEEHEGQERDAADREGSRDRSRRAGRRTEAVLELGDVVVEPRARHPNLANEV